MTHRKPFRIGLIADTHGLFDPSIERHFQGVDWIIHAGDIGNRSVIERLEAIAPVIAVSGNVDDAASIAFPFETVVRLAGRRIAVRHIVYEGGKLRKDALVFLEHEQPDVCIFGHTHQPKVDRLGKTLLINPGSAGPKRFTLPRGIALVALSGTRILPSLIRLHDRPGRTFLSQS